MTSSYTKRGKRCFDLLVSLLLLAPLLPLLLLVSALVLMSLGRPILFRQRRAGLLGRPFILLKFRTMRDTRDATGRLLADEIRLTAFGRLLRSTSLDELPGIWNVIRGDMSLIGPRPLLVEYIGLYDRAQARRLEVRPGMAGYAALFGRNAQSWESIFARDVWYVDHVCFRLDLEIILGVVRVVLSRKGIDRGSHDNGSEFAARLRARKGADMAAANR